MNVVDSRQGSEQNNEQTGAEITGEDRRQRCLKIMKKLFFSLLLGTIIAVCWVLVIHTLKWIAIKGNEFELLTVVQQQQQQQRQHLHQHRVGHQFMSIREAGSDFNGTIDDPLLNRTKLAAESEQARSRNRSTDNRLMRRQEDTAAGAKLDEELQASPVIERQTFAHKRVLHLSSIAGQQEQQQQEPPPPPQRQDKKKSNPSEPVMEPTMVDDELAARPESNYADELIPLSSQPESAAPSQTSGADSYFNAADSMLSEDKSGEDQPKRVAGLVYRAPFFTSWFISTWNILFMPVFALISSCCFMNEDNTTKKLLV